MIFWIVAGIMIYLWIGNRLAKRWYVPEAEKLMVENPSPIISNSDDRRKKTSAENYRETIRWARWTMIFFWLPLALIESLTDCAIFRSSV